MKIRWPVMLILFLMLALALAGGFTMLWRLFIFLAVLLIISYIWMRFLVRGIEGRVDKSPQHCRVGESFEEEFTFVNSGRLPAALVEGREITNLPGYSNIVKFPLASRGSYSWRTRGLCQVRGQYHIGGLTARISDPLGFFSVSRDYSESKYITVLPATIDLPFFEALPRQDAAQSGRRWFAGEPGPNASRVREYASGDSLRRIHWHSTAHTGHLMVKEFDPDLTRYYSFNDIWIVLDMHRETESGEGEETTAEYGVTIAASLVKKYLEIGKRVGFMASGDRSYLFPPDTGDEHISQIMQALAVLKPAGEVPLGSLLTSQEERFDTGSAAVIIIPAGFQSLGIPLRRVINRGTAVTAILLDAISFGGNIAAAETSRGLAASGIYVYIVRRGVEIARALDIRHFSSGAQYTGVKKQG